MRLVIPYLVLVKYVNSTEHVMVVLHILVHLCFLKVIYVTDENKDVNFLFFRPISLSGNCRVKILWWGFKLTS